MKIDIFCHIMPPKFLAAFEKKISPNICKHLPYNFLPSLVDLDTRFRIMDNYEDMVQVLTLTNPPIEVVAEPVVAVELAKIANDEMAELVAKYPDRFVGAGACLPMNDLDAALKELDRAIKELNLNGIQIFTNIMGKPLNSPEFMPLYEKMNLYNLPIWIHPVFPSDNITVKDKSQFDRARSADQALQVTYQTPAAMASLIYGHVLDTYSGIKFITHHCGSTVPYYADRIEMSYHLSKKLESNSEAFAKPILEYYKSFYADTALHGNVSALMCGYNFFDASHILFGTDMPFDAELGLWSVRKTIESIYQMDITETERSKIFEDNARELLRLSL